MYIGHLYEHYFIISYVYRLISILIISKPIIAVKLKKIPNTSKQIPKLWQDHIIVSIAYTKNFEVKLKLKLQFDSENWWFLLMCTKLLQRCSVLCIRWDKLVRNLLKHYRAPHYSTSTNFMIFRLYFAILNNSKITQTSTHGRFHVLFKMYSYCLGTTSH